MNLRDNKVVLISLSVAAGILLITTIAFYVIKENQKEKIGTLQKHLDETTAAKQNLEVKLKDVEIANAEMKSAVAAKDEKIDMLNKYLEEQKTLNGKAISKLQERDFEIRSLKAKIEEEKAEKEELIKRSDKLHENYLNIKFQLANLIKTKEEMERKARELADKEGVSLGTVVIKQAPR